MFIFTDTSMVHDVSFMNTFNTYTIQQKWIVILDKIRQRVIIESDRTAFSTNTIHEIYNI